MARQHVRSLTTVWTGVRVVECRVLSRRITLVNEPQPQLCRTRVLPNDKTDSAAEPMKDVFPVFSRGTICRIARAAESWSQKNAFPYRECPWNIQRHGFYARVWQFHFLPAQPWSIRLLLRHLIFMSIVKRKIDLSLSVDGYVNVLVYFVQRIYKKRGLLIFILTILIYTIS